MRTTLASLLLLVTAPACSHAVAETGVEVSGEAPPALDIVTPPVTGSGPKKTAPTNPYGPAGEAGCSWGVNGAVEAWVDDANSWAWVWGGGSLQCEGSVAGITHSVTLDLSGLNGPGHYEQAGSGSYLRTVCATGDTSCTYDGFAAPTGTVACVADVTSAPTPINVGSEVRGTFSCSSLASSKDPTRTVAIYAGSFWAQVTPLPD